MSASRFLGELDMIRQVRKYDVTKAKGFTLVEALVVVVIIGVLSSMGVVGLQGAVQNSRIKDAGQNVAAFMERTANEANRRSAKMCVKVASDQVLKTYLGDCDEKNPGSAIDEFTLESQNKFVTSASNLSECSTIYGGSTAASFSPKLGLSAVPAGCFVVRYGASDKFAAIIKLPTRNSVFYKLSYDSGSSWSQF